MAALEEAAAGAQRAALRSAELQALLARAQERLPAAQEEVAAAETLAQLEQLKAKVTQYERQEADFRRQEAGLQCVVCMDAKKSVCLLPCKHMCMCQPCASKVMAASAQCPVCREPVADSFEMFM